MQSIVFSAGILVVSGLLAAVLSRSGRLSQGIALAGVWIASALALQPVIACIGNGAALSLKCGWNVPWGSFNLSLDGLSAFFLIPIIILSPLTALYGVRYLSHAGKPLGAVWFFFNTLVASMIVLVAANNGMVFLMAWEVMAMSSFFLVMFDHEHLRVRKAGWIYLVATHIGTAFLLAFFALMGAYAGSLDFERIAGTAFSPVTAGTLFVLALIGFGTKAGFIPLHVWLPEAHPAAPSHVSSLMSGVMIKMGIYGLLRALTLLGNPPAVWGWTLVVVGAVSGILGVAFALAQHDLKRLLAYHSVENIGIITLGIGTGLLGVAWHEPSLALLGFGGGILHVLNHAVFKGLLFLGAGSVVYGGGSLDIDRCGGLLKRMPWTGVTFLIGAAAISGLPPLNGFISEFFIYSAGFQGALTGSANAVMLAAVILVSLALIGGLAAACFTKCFGIVFLGEPREKDNNRIHEVPAAMRWPMAILAAICLGIGLSAAWVMRLVEPAVSVMSGYIYTAQPVVTGTTVRLAGGISMVFGALIALTLVLVFIRRSLPRAKDEHADETWGCGYVRPTPRMQYTASSFAAPLTDLFATCLGTNQSGEGVRGFFPKHASFASHTPDIAREKLFKPLFLIIDRIIAPARKLQHGGIHLYVFYIFITLIVLLVWKVGFVR